tara:strand:+ start:246 stop:503 length:258 start_codon:yes stop_codon:yes gene_type:complete
MIKLDEKSNAQSWELEITCKNKKYLNEVVKAVLSYGMIDFEVENIECLSSSDGWEGRYTVFMWCCWFNNLACISKDLKKIEKRLG